MRFAAVAAMSLALAAAGAAQNCVFVAPGCPCAAFSRPACQNTVSLAVIGAGNPSFEIGSTILDPCMPAGLPIFLLLGIPGPTAAVPGFLVDPGFGLPCTLGMPSVLLAVDAGVTGTTSNAPFPVPIPPGLAGLGHVLTAQMVVLAPAGIGLSGASGIIL